MLLIQPIPKKVYAAVPVLSFFGLGSSAGLFTSLSVSNPNIVATYFGVWGFFAFTLSTTISLILASRQSEELAKLKTAQLMSVNYQQVKDNDPEDKETEEMIEYKERVKKEGPGFVAFKPGWNSYFQQAKNMNNRDYNLTVPVTSGGADADNKTSNNQVKASGYRNGKNEPPHNKINPEIPNYVSVKQMLVLADKFFKTEEGKKLTVNYWVSGKTKVFIRRSQFEPLLDWMEGEGLVCVKDGNGAKVWTHKGMEWLGKLKDVYSPTPGTIKKR